MWCILFSVKGKGSEGTRIIWCVSAEKSVKLVVNTDWKIPPKVNFQVLGYYQQINDFIYLQPQQEFRLTLRGAFPVYIYHQADSRIYGADFLFSSKRAYERAFNLRGELGVNRVNLLVVGDGFEGDVWHAAIDEAALEVAGEFGVR